MDPHRQTRGDGDAADCGSLRRADLDQRHAPWREQRGQLRTFSRGVNSLLGL